MATQYMEIRHEKSIFSQWTLIKAFGNRDLKSKFNGTLLGWLWSLVVPLATLGIYSLIFSIIFRMQVPPMGGPHGQPVFALWFFAGLTMWGFFQNSVNAGMNGLLSCGGLLQKVYFPSYTPVIGAGLAIGVQSLIEIGLLLTVLLVFLNVSWTWLLILPLFAIYTVFTWSFSVIFAVWNAHVRDMAHLISVALQLLFYLTPIIYPPSIAPQAWHGIPLQLLISNTPFAEFVILFRDLCYGLEPGSIGQWVSIVGWTGIVFALAVFVYRKYGTDLGERL
ncbi:MAG: ABC transporter permease [Trueperella sp.]|uniref:ABC transporter permease n=2 Tax=Trueperella sp. TaxID=2699835 RepID=UPI0025DE4FC1|nr:ABC transporter permease [Trueperella sp.]MCI7306554.1 ABC transporter permease [Trueperella sp.]